ncbi:Cupin domain-containing protein [Cladophialophora immunda]|nr:Cupin domain-containing protein [Cladophialophora immunda]
MEQLSHLPETRRLVTGHNREGKAVFEFDDLLTPVNPTPKDARPGTSADRPVGVTLIHRTRNYPVKIQGGREELTMDNVRRGQGEKGIVCQIVDIPPTPKGAKPYLHRNESLDYGVVLKGSLQLLLDDGAVETLREGDVYIQKGTYHAWLNESTEYCRFLTVVIPSEKVKVEATGEFLEVTKIPGLSD